MFGKKKKIKRITKFSSFAFWLSIPCTFFLGSTFLLTSWTLTAQKFFDHEKWSLFLMGFLGGVVLLQALRLERTRTFLHESKHALLVILSGGRLKGFHVRRDGGRVDFELSERLVSHGPAIVLAPYCFPMLSLPVFCAALLFETGRTLIFSVLLGFTLGIDLAMCLGEIRPVQTDFKQVQGGFLFAALYIGGWLFCWSNLVVVWIVGGQDAIWYSLLLALRILERLVLSVRQ